VKKILLVSIVLFLLGCSSKIAYQPSRIGVAEAVENIEELITTQHRAWRPDQVNITDKYIAWGYGSKSLSSGIGFSSGNMAFGDSSTITRAVGQRMYFKNIHSIRLKSWVRNFKKWYVVSAYGKHDNLIKHIFYSRYLENSQRLVDSIESLMEHEKSSQ